MVTIDFEIETKYGTYRDALNLEDDHGLSEQEIEAMKQQRADSWVAHVDVASTEESTPFPPAAEIPEIPTEELPTE
jgi:hypothetical protein